jgi:hypothetical protein
MLGLASRYPAIGWEPVYMACAEAVTYGLYSQGHAYIEMKNGTKSPSLSQLPVCECADAYVHLDHPRVLFSMMLILGVSFWDSLA